MNKRKILVKGPSTKEIMDIFHKSIVYGEKSALIKLTNYKTSFEVIIEKVDARIWQLPQSVFIDNPKFKKVLFLHGWINREESKKLSSSVTKKCTVEIYTDNIFLKII